MLWIGIPLAVVCLLIVLIVLPLEIRIHYHHLHEDDGGAVEIRYLFGLVHFRRELTEAKVGLSDEGPAVAVKSSSPQEPTDSDSGSKVSMGDILKNIDPLLKHIRQSRPILKQLAPHIHIRHFQLEASVGVQDAIYTGMAVGAMYAVVEGILGVISYHCSFHKRPRIKVHPIYQGVGFHIRMDSIIHVRLGYAINAVRKLLFTWKRGT